MSEHIWLFRMNEGGTHLGDNGLKYFELRAAEMASMTGCHLVSSKEIKIEQWHNDVWMVSGTAILAAN